MNTNRAAAKRQLGGQESDVTRERFVLEHSNAATRARQVVRNNQGRPVGVIENGWLVKRNLDRARHMLHRPEGWCTDEEHLKLPIRGIRLYTTTGDVWESDLSGWREYGVRVSLGYGKQVLLPTRFWRTLSKGARQLALI